MIVEHHDQLVHRLKAEGKFRFYEKTFRKFKSDGIDEDTARELAVTIVDSRSLKSEDVPVVDEDGVEIINAPQSCNARDGDVFKNCNEEDKVKVVQWVFDHVGINDVKPEDAPSSGAWFLLNEIRSNDQLRAEFYKTIFPKIFLTRQQVKGNTEGSEDDGRKQLAVIESLRAALK